MWNQFFNFVNQSVFEIFFLFFVVWCLARHVLLLNRLQLFSAYSHIELGRAQSEARNLRNSKETIWLMPRTWQASLLFEAEFIIAFLPGIVALKLLNLLWIHERELTKNEKKPFSRLLKAKVISSEEVFR